ncbi:hypothetical protein EDEG_02620 [Edhazardia aedis USNM 41457]|uniref:Uncharacterized protein n=1 Tax=Edhazardia aedis (strain USNM 41457) TaxID=1003232 RepID=J9D596_EDHAE|nr:hypothetical protein EDEG_02620 [Edhazardia aedis USNM 41457]|eukprot:EJW02976.1 hypothetical protein EDEG_02620 [Edhazardia aedis USNM 41457]
MGLDTKTIVISICISIVIGAAIVFGVFYYLKRRRIKRLIALFEPFANQLEKKTEIPENSRYYFVTNLAVVIEEIIIERNSLFGEDPTKNVKKSKIYNKLIAEYKQKLWSYICEEIVNDFKKYNTDEEFIESNRSTLEKVNNTICSLIKNEYLGENNQIQLIDAYQMLFQYAGVIDDFFEKCISVFEDKEICVILDKGTGKVRAIAMESVRNLRKIENIEEKSKQDSNYLRFVENDMMKCTFCYFKLITIPMEKSKPQECPSSK